MLTGIPKCLSPDLLKVLSEMGHGDELVLADAHYPAASNARLLARADGIGIPELLDAILGLIPLDQYVEQPVALMETVGGDPTPEIWDEYRKIIRRHEGRSSIEYMERMNFYERGRRAYAIVATGEEAICANVILKKGVVGR